MNNQEHLIYAGHSAGFLVDELRLALNASNEVERLLILKMIEQAAGIMNEIKRLNEAIALTLEVD